MGSHRKLASANARAGGICAGVVTQGELRRSRTSSKIAGLPAPALTGAWLSRIPVRRMRRARRGRPIVRSTVRSSDPESSSTCTDGSSASRRAATQTGIARQALVRSRPRSHDPAPASAGATLLVHSTSTTPPPRSDNAREYRAGAPPRAVHQHVLPGSQPLVDFTWNAIGQAIGVPAQGKRALGLHLYELLRDCERPTPLRQRLPPIANDPPHDTAASLGQTCSRGIEQRRLSLPEPEGPMNTSICLTSNHPLRLSPYLLDHRLVFSSRSESPVAMKHSRYLDPCTIRAGPASGPSPLNGCAANRVAGLNP